MMERHAYSNECPKCGRVGSRTIAKYTPGNKGPHCTIDDCANTEHLHVPCACGYSYSMDTADQGAPDSNTDFPDVTGPEELSSGANLYR
jgi:hypothetical protein